MEHCIRTPRLSVVDTELALRLSSQVPDRATLGISEIRATVPDAAGGALEHVWVRAQDETAGDFLAMALAAARELGLKAVVVTGIIAAAEEERG
jgi:hypothetical protein